MKKIGTLLLFVCAVCFVVPKSDAQVSLSISVGVAPPVMPVYVQPACPTDGYLWQPGYWAYDPTDGYYWVPGVWVAAPQPGYLWTPPYWGFEGGHYGFHAGYWGVHVGFYGGINYGFGYGGWGFGGGAWSGGHFRYNTAVVNVNRTVIHNTYIDRTVIRNTYVNNHTSFNGPGGVTAKPRPEEEAAMKERHIPPTANQVAHRQAASKDRSQFAKYNGGHPAAAAMDKVGGHPYNAQGHVSKTSTLGHASAAAKRNAAPKVNRPAGKANRPANVQKPANANRPAAKANRPAARTNRPANTSRPANTKRPANANRPAPRVNRPAVAKQQPARTSRPANVQRPARQQPHNAPKPAAPREKHN